MSTIDRAAVPAPAPIRPFSLPVPEVRRLSNGLSIYHAARRGLPVATIDVILDAGAATEPAERAGLARLTIRSLETGTAGRSGDDIAWAFDKLGIELESHASWDAATLRVTGPADRIERALALAAELVLEPAFPPAEVERLREQQLGELRQRAKEPGSLASDAAARFIFGDAATYGRSILGSASSVADLDRDDLVRFHAARFSPRAAALVATGDLDADQVAAMAERHLGRWHGLLPPRPDIAPPAPEPGPRIHLVHRAGAVQSEIRVGHVGVARRHPDYFAVRVMNTLLGGAFTSRLNLNLRERQGFTYGVRSGFAFRREPGPFLITTAVATDVTAPAVTEILNEVRGLHERGATHDEIAAARDYLAGVLPLELQTTAQLADRLAELPVYGLDAAEFTDYAERIRAVSDQLVDRAAREHLHPDRLAIVIVGNADQIRAPLQDLGIADVQLHDAPK